MLLESFKEIWYLDLQQWTGIFPPPPAGALLRNGHWCHLGFDGSGRLKPFGRPRWLLRHRNLVRRRRLQEHTVAVGEGAVLLHAEDQVVLFKSGDGMAGGAGAEAGVFHDLGDGVEEKFLVSSAAPGLVAAQDQQHLELGTVEVGR